MSGQGILASSPRGHGVSSEWVPRFGLTERFAHWWTVSMVAAALLTGLAMGDEAESGPLLTAHLTAVILIGAGLVSALVLGNTRAVWSWSSGGEDNSAHGIAVIVAMSLVAGRIFMAALNPMTTGALNGMILGRVRRSWAAQHHCGWLHEIDRDSRMARR